MKKIFTGIIIIVSSFLFYDIYNKYQTTHEDNLYGIDSINNKFNNKMFVMEQKGYKIIQKNVKIKKTMDSYALCGKITYNKPIGKVSYIDVKKIEEETVSINERN